MTITNQFEAFYQDFGTADLAHLAQLYDAEVLFRDPIHQVKGLSALEHYFRSTRRGLNFCHFEFIDAVKEPHTAMYQWHMRYSHQRLKGGKELLLPGVTVLQLGTQITSHEDYYDLGAMLYEHIPVIGSVVQWLRARLAG